jgi:hypothetical protein
MIDRFVELLTAPELEWFWPVAIICLTNMFVELMWPGERGKDE